MSIDSLAFRWSYGIAVAVAPLGAWGMVFAALARWQQPETEGTTIGFSANCVTVAVFLIVTSFAFRHGRPLMWVSAGYIYLVTSMLLLIFALTCQIRMLLPIDL